MRSVLFSLASRTPSGNGFIAQFFSDSFHQKYFKQRLIGNISFVGKHLEFFENYFREANRNGFRGRLEIRKRRKRLWHNKSHILVLNEAIRHATPEAT